VRLDGILDEVRIGILDHPAAAQRIGVREALVEVDHVVAVRADALAGSGAILGDAHDALAGVVDVRPLYARRVEAIEAIPRLDTLARAFLKRPAGAAEARRVGFEIVADSAAEELVDGRV